MQQINLLLHLINVTIISRVNERVRKRTANITCEHLTDNNDKLCSCWSRERHLDKTFYLLHAVQKGKQMHKSNHSVSKSEVSVLSCQTCLTYN